MEGGPYLSNQGKATNGCEEGHNHGRDLTNGEFSLLSPKLWNDLPVALRTAESEDSTVALSTNQLTDFTLAKLW